MFTIERECFLSLNCRTLLNTYERVFIGLHNSLRRARSNPYTWLHPIPSLVTECTARVFASTASPRGTGPRWDVPQLARLELHHAQYEIDLLDVIWGPYRPHLRLKLPEGHKIPTAQEMNGRPYCKWHHSFTHITNDCKELRRQIQTAIEQGRLILGQFAMKVDTQIGRASCRERVLRLV